MGTEKKRIILLLSKYLERDDVRDIESLSIGDIVRGKQQHTAVERRRPRRPVDHGKRKLRCNPAATGPPARP